MSELEYGAGILDGEVRGSWTLNGYPNVERSTEGGLGDGAVDSVVKRIR